MQALPAFSARGSTNHVASWYQVLTKETKGHIHVAGFEPIIRSLPDTSASAILVQCLAERWWNTTHTFNIVGREMTITPHNFHRMTGLRFDGVLIGLEDELGIRLGIDLLERRYAIEMIRYTDLEANFMHPP